MKFCFSITHASQYTNANLLIHSIATTEIDYDIYIFVPSNLSLPLFELDVHLEYFELNHSNALFPFLDKIYAAAYCECIMDTSFLWLDVDSYFNQAFSNRCKGTLMINPVDKKNIGVLSGAHLSDLWLDLLNIVQVSEAFYRLHTVETTISKEEIYPYYNIGMVYLSPNYSIFQDTKQILNAALSDQSFKDKLTNTPSFQVFLHQAIFSLVVLKNLSFDQILPLEKGLNFPIHLLNDCDHQIDLKDVVSFRYDTYFASHPWPKEMVKPLKIREKELKMVWYYEFQ